MTEAKRTPLSVHGWAIYAHPLFLDQLESLVREVEVLRHKDPQGYLKKNATKRLQAIKRLAFDVIARDPASTDFRQGATLGGEHRHWFRAKFFQQYRLFFRFHSAARIIVLVWVNDDHSKRADESGDDAYKVFRKMLGSGHPPDDWEQLLSEAACASDRFRSSMM